MLRMTVCLERGGDELWWYHREHSDVGRGGCEQGLQQCYGKKAPRAGGGGGRGGVSRYHRQCSDIGDYIFHSPGASDGQHHLLLLRVGGHIVRRLMLTPCGSHLGKVQVVVCTA